MVVTCAVNGFGRIGRLSFRYAWEDPTLEIVHVNDLCSVESAAYLIKYDSVHGTWDKEVEITEDGSGFTVDGKLVTFTQESDFTKVDWAEKNTEMVMECTGKFLKVKELDAYFEQCGVKRVVICAPVKEEGALISLSSSVRVIKENFGIKHGFIPTVHDVTATQTLVKMPNTKNDDSSRHRK